MTTKQYLSTLLAAVLLASSPAAARDQNKKFTLGRAVPADSWLYFHGAQNPERDFLEKHWSHVFEALKAAGLDADIKKLLGGQRGTDQEKADFDQIWEKAFSLYKGINWGDLFDREVVLFARSYSDWTLLTLPKQDTLEANVEGLVAVMRELASHGDDIRIEESNIHGAVAWSLRSAEIPFSVTIFRRGELVGLSTSEATVKKLLAGLSGESKMESLIAGPRYRQAISQLPQPEDSILFCDMQRVLSSMRQHLGSAHNQNGKQQTHGSEKEFMINLFDQLDFVDYIASTEQTQGLQTITHSVTKLKKGAAEKKFCKAITGQKPIANVLSHVPLDATGYWASSGVDLGLLYSFVLDVVSGKPEEGLDPLARWTEIQEEYGFNLQDDFLSWIEGQVIAVTFPAAMQTGLSSDETLLKVKVRNGNAAMASIKKQLDHLKDTFFITPASAIKADGFQSLTHPMMALMGLGQVVFGVDDNWLYVSTSPSAVNKCLATARGESPSFAKNERFVSEGVLPEGPVASATFSDKSNQGQKLAMTLATAPMILGMVMPPSAGNDNMRVGLAMLGKLSPVAARLNFQRSASTVCTFKDGRWLTKSVSTYKEYAPPAKQPGKSSKKQLDGL